MLLNFWATWCPSCPGETADLNATNRRFRSRGFILLAISDENARKQQRFLSKYKVNYPMLVDIDDQIRQRFRVEGIPMSLIYNREGALVSQSLGRPSIQKLSSMIRSAGLQ